jgi:hypothetical protein
LAGKPWYGSSFDSSSVSAPNADLPAQNGYGLGLMRLDVGGRDFYGHVGWFMGSTSIAMFAPDDGAIVAVTSNLSRPDLVQVLADIHDVQR